MRSGSKPPACLWPKWSWSLGSHLQHHSHKGVCSPGVVSCRSGPACPFLDHPYQSPSGPMWVSRGCSDNNHSTITTGTHATKARAYPTRLWPGGHVVRMGCLQRRPVLSGPMPQRGPPAPQPNSTGLSTTRHGMPTSF